jgi:hypothetical protein
VGVAVSLYTITVLQLDRWKDKNLLTEDNEFLGELALNLAQTLDNGAGLAQAAVANQYRAAMDAIRRTKTDDDDQEWQQFVNGLGTPSTSPLGH